MPFPGPGCGGTNWTSLGKGELTQLGPRQPPWPLCSCVPHASTGVASDGVWLMSTGHATWLLSASSEVGPVIGRSRFAPALPSTRRRVCFPDILVPDRPIFLFTAPHQPAEVFATGRETLVLTPGHESGAPLELCPRGGCFLTIVRPLPSRRSWSCFYFSWNPPLSPWAATPTLVFVATVSSWLLMALVPVAIDQWVDW